MIKSQHYKVNAWYTKPMLVMQSSFQQHDEWSDLLCLIMNF